MAASEHHHHAGMWVFPRPETVSQDLSSKTAGVSQGFRIALLVSSALFALGIIGFIGKAVSDGFGEHGPWGYYMAIFSFIFMVTGAAPLAAVAFRFTKSHWRRPLSRVAELFAVVHVLNVLMFIPLMIVFPAIQNPATGDARRTIWFEVPIGAPHWWDFLGIFGLAFLSIAILWLSAMPDMAQGRANATGFRRMVYDRLAGHWYGAKRQWHRQKVALGFLGAWYFMFLVYVQFIISSDYGQSMVPGWKDSIFPPFYSLTSFQAGLGLILVTLFILRRHGGYQEYIGVSTFWSASKVLLGLTLLWGYHLFTFVMIFWYGRLPVEQNILKFLFVESYGGLFAANFFFSFVAPFLTLLWNPVRKTDWGPALAGIFALIGALMFNLRTFVGAFNAGDIYAAFLDHVPPAVWPDIWDILLIFGAMGAVAAIYLGATRIIPVISVWETKEGAMYQRMGTLFRGRYLVLAKPE